jgi:hypothetical protein
MINILALFPSSMTAEELDIFVPLTIAGFKSAQGLRSLTMSDGPLMSPDGMPAYSKVVSAEFESLEIFMAWAQSPAAAADSEMMKSSGMVRLFYEVTNT